MVTLLITNGLQDQAPPRALMGATAASFYKSFK